MKFSFVVLCLVLGFSAGLFTFYSYSQIDLNLTLSSWPAYQQAQAELIRLGYYNRPLSALFYLLIILLLFLLYFLLSKYKELSFPQAWLLIFGLVVILLFSYPAFSHDIFNYIFDARILVKYQASPWTHTALDFPQDPWTRFMHWTHRTYPYGPAWLAASYIPYTLGLGKFVLTLVNFKLFLALSYLGSCLLIYKITQKISGLVLFAFNPLVIIESLVSPHLDIFMTFLGLLGIWLLKNSKRTSGIVILVLSVLVKYATAGYLPLIIKKYKLAIALTLAAIIGQILLREILPWYFLPFIALAFVSQIESLKLPIVGLSLGGVLYYAPFIYLGEINDTLKLWRLILFFVPIFLAIITELFWVEHSRSNK